MSGKFIGIFLLAVLMSCECSKILCMHPSFSKSHVMPLQALAKELAKRGHEVTFVTLYPLDKPVKNYRDIKIELNEEESKVYAEIGKGMAAGENIFKMFPILDKVLYEYGTNMIQSSTIKNLMMNEKFDLVIAGYFMNDYLLGFADHFKCPSIIFFPGPHVSSLNAMVGSPLSIEGTPHGIMHAAELSSFIPRVKNMLLYTVDLVVFRMFFYYRAKGVYE